MYIKSGSTNKHVYMYFQDAITGGPYTTTGGETSFNLSYTQHADSAETTSAASQGTKGTHGDNTITHVGRGIWQVDFPDGAWDGTDGDEDRVVLIVDHDDDTILPVVLNVDLNERQVDVAKISGDGTAADQLEAMLDGNGGHDGSNVVLTIGQFRIDAGNSDGGIYVTNDSGDAVHYEATAGNGDGFHAIGYGSGSGLYAYGGGTGDGILGITGGTRGEGIAGISDASIGGSGIYAKGKNDPGVYIEGGSPNGDGVKIIPAGTGKVMNVDVSSIAGTTLTLPDAIEALVAVICGKASFNTTTGVVSFKGRDGTTERVTVTITGDGVRSVSTLSEES